MLWYRKAGNPFNTTVIPSPPAFSPLSPLSPFRAPSPQSDPPAQVYGPPTSPLPETGTEKKKTTNKIAWIAIAGLFVLVALVLGVCLSMFRCCKRRSSSDKTAKMHEVGTYGALKGAHKRDHQSPKNPFTPIQKGGFIFLILLLFHNCVKYYFSSN